jgi:protoheme IX farnesyltransferase
MKEIGATICADSSPVLRARWADYAELAKPRVGLLVLFTVAAGAWLAAPRDPNPTLIFHVVTGMALVVAGASALNQVWERDTDARMSRTANRPLPTGRLSVIEALILGCVLAAVGMAYLAMATRNLLPVALAAMAFIAYVFVYTPLKRRSTLNTLVGAIPGALPPVIGWASIRGTLNLEAAILFAILFLWQVPHFLAIAWIYRGDYRDAGMFMLPVVDRSGRLTGRQMIGYALALLAISLTPATCGIAGPWYAVAAFVLGLIFLYTIVGFLQESSTEQARRVLRASLLYLPALLAVLLIDTILIR